MTSIPLQKGFATSRWKRCTEIMLEKDPGNPMIHRLRIIVLLEADFNLALRTIWMRRLFTQAEKANFVDEQWGNRKNKNVLDCLTMKLLTCESARIMKTNMALMAMDAAACYDRILTYLSSMSERRYDIPVSACRTKGAAIFEMQRHVRTAYGESSNSYTSTTNDLMHGECQGKTSSPPSWAIYTITLLKALKQYNPGVSITNVEGQNKISRVADMFVDDCDLWTSLPMGDTERELVDQFTKAAQAWERILFASGGLLALHKCYWWLISWDWNNGLPLCRSPTFDDYTVKLSNGNDDASVPIRRLSLDESNVGLGFRLAPSGCLDSEIFHRKQMSDTMASNIDSTSLPPTEAWIFYKPFTLRKYFIPVKLQHAVTGSGNTSQENLQMQ